MISREEIISKLNWRYATKKYDASKKISSTDWNVLKEALRLSPSSYGLQPWKFFVIEKPELREQLKTASWGQTQVTDASHYVVLVYKEKMDEAHINKFIQKNATVRGVAADTMKGYADMMVGDLVKGPRSAIIEAWAQRQAYIAMGFLLETAALLDIDATPLEGIDPVAYDKLLDLTGSGWKTVAAVALGYRHAEDGLAKAKKVRFDENEVFVTK